MSDRVVIAAGRSVRGSVSHETSTGSVAAWALVFGTLAALPGLVALGVGLAVADVLVVSAVTCGALAAAAAMVGGFPRERENVRRSLQR